MTLETCRKRLELAEANFGKPNYKQEEVEKEVQFWKNRIARKEARRKAAEMQQEKINKLVNAGKEDKKDGKKSKG